MDPIKYYPPETKFKFPDGRAWTEQELMELPLEKVLLMLIDLEKIEKIEKLKQKIIADGDPID